MKFKREFVQDVIEEIKPLIRKHFAEIALFQDIPLDPNYEAYALVEKVGALRIFTARSDEGELQGYAFFFVRQHIHSKNSIQATQDLLFIDPNHRGAGLKFIRFCEGELKQEGVDVIYQTVTTRCNFELMLVRLGYELTEKIYTRRV